MTDAIGLVMIAAGLVFDVLGCLGLIRLPDVYNRLQASTKCVTLGTCSILIGTLFVTVDVGECYIRELCKAKGLELGGDLCVLFYNYLAGYIGRMSDSRLKLVESAPGDKACRYKVQVIRRS